MNNWMNHSNGSLSFGKKMNKWLCDLEYFGFVVNWLRNHTSRLSEQSIVPHASWLNQDNISFFESLALNILQNVASRAHLCKFVFS